LNVSATNIMSKCRIASIELDDAMILGRGANPDGSNFRKGQVCQVARCLGQDLAKSKDLGTPSAAILRAVLAAPPLALLHERAIESFLGLKLQRA
jgi:hypothetical protein